VEVQIRTTGKCKVGGYASPPLGNTRKGGSPATGGGDTERYFKMLRKLVELGRQEERKWKTSKGGLISRGIRDQGELLR